MVDDTPLLLTYREVAKLLSCSDRHVWTLVNRGQLPAVRLARRAVRIDRRDVVAFIDRVKGKSLKDAESAP